MFRVFARVFVAWVALFGSGGPAWAQSPPAWNTLFGTAITCNDSGCRINNGPGCNTAAVPGQCSFPRANAQALCTAHGACQALTCNAARNDCQARDASESARLLPRPDFTSLQRAAAAPGAQPGWATQIGGAIHCAAAGNTACRISSGPACNTTAVPGQCSFPKPSAQASCLAHGRCAALTCNLSRGDCQARDEQEAKAWVPDPQYLSLLAPRPSVAVSPPPSEPSDAKASSTKVVLPAYMQGAISRLVLAMPVGNEQAKQAMVDKLMNGLKADGKWFSASHESVDLHAYLNPTDPSHQVLALVFRGNAGVPDIFGPFAATLFGNSAVRDVILSVSLQDEEMKAKDLPKGLVAVLAGPRYFGTDEFEFKGGMQFAANIVLGGMLKTVFVTGVGARMSDGNSPEFVIKAGMAESLPSYLPDSNSTGDRSRKILDLINSFSEEAAKKGKPKEPELNELFAELQMPPSMRVPGPMGLRNLALTQGTFSIATEGLKIKTIGFKGYINAAMATGWRPFLGFFEGPVSVAGAPDLLEAKFGLATSKIGLGDMAYLATVAWDPEPNSIAAKGGGMMAKLDPLKSALGSMLEPLNAVAISNPHPVPAYVSGGDFPDATKFNLVVLGPLAKEGESKGPFFRVVGNAEVLGSNFGRINAMLSESGLATTASANVSLTPVSGVTLGALSSALDVKVDARDQRARLNGSLSVAGVGRSADISLEPKKISFISKPQGAGNCVVPLDIQASYDMPNAGDIAKFRLTNILSGVNWPGPEAVATSVGDGLKACAGFIWADIQKAGKLIGKGGQIVAKGAEDAAKEAAKAAQATAQATKRAAEAAGRASAVAAKATASATAAAAEGAGRAVVQAANVVAGGARDLFSDPGKAISSWVKGSSEPECNRRQRILGHRDGDARNQGIDVTYIPTNRSMDDFTNRVINPTLGSDAKVNAFIQHIQGFEGRLSVATGSLTALQQQWNSATRAAGGATLPPSLTGAVISELEGHKLANKRVPGKFPRNSLERISAVMAVATTDQHFKEWLGFRQIAEGYDRGQLSQGPAQAYRCARDHTADIPVKLARAWGTYLPEKNSQGQSQKREQVEARETTPRDYKRVIDELAERVRVHNAGIDQSMGKFSAFSDSWVKAAAKVVLDLRVGMEGVLIPEARAAMADPVQAARLSKEIAQWEQTSNGLGDVLNGLLVFPADRRLAVFNADFYRKTYSDMRAASEDDVTNHWLRAGLSEGRQGSSSFSLQLLSDRYADLRGPKMIVLDHWFNHGQYEGRNPTPGESKPFPSTPNAAQAAELIKRLMDAANALNNAAKAL